MRAQRQLSPMLGYVELQVTSNFSFLEGGSHPEELVARAKAMGLSALAITDRNTLSGVVRAHVAAKAAGMRLIIGARLDLVDGLSLLCLPTNRAAYGRLCQLLSLGQRRADKGQCTLTLQDVAAHAQGQIFIALAPESASLSELLAKPGLGPGLEPAPKQAASRAFATDLARLKQHLGATLHLAASMTYRGWDRARLNALAELAHRHAIPLVATGAVLYHVPGRKSLQDVLTAIAHKTTVATAGHLLEANAERHLRSPAAMARLFQGHEGAIARTLAIMDACRFSLDELIYEYPDEPAPHGVSPQTHLETLTFEGAKERYPGGVPPHVASMLARELDLIKTLDYARYFLTVHDIVSFAHARGILAQGRGSAANSAVCYCLKITAVDPTEIDLLFERFIAAERNEPPDIDVDFEHERREEVIQYIYARYGRDRAGLAATVISYRARSAVREVGKAMGLSEDTVAALSGMVWGTRSGDALPDTHVHEAGLDPRDPLLATTLGLARELIGFPRHLSQHVGGFVLTRGPLSEVVPIGNAAMAERTFIEWDKDDLDTLGLLKIDVLALGMLSCIRRAFDLMALHHGRPMSLATVPREDGAVYDMLCKADSLGVFQIESRAQMNMLPRLKPRCFYDLVIEVAIVRPGPIQGDMVHPYLRRRDGLEAETYPAPSPEHGPPDELKAILGKTKGVPLFQEQAMRIAMTAARFSGAEVNELRRAMATFRRRGTIEQLQDKMVSRMVERGYSQEFAGRCFDQIKGFGEYGFPESHAASFAHLVYVSAWLKCHYPAVFCASLLNSQPMGFYAPAQIVRDAREHGVRVREVDVNESAWEATLEGGEKPGQPDDQPAVRLGLRQIDGLGETMAQALVAARTRLKGGRFQSIQQLQTHAGLPRAVIERLAAADAFGSLGLDRRQALWDVRGLQPLETLPLFAASGASERGLEEAVALPRMSEAQHVVADYQTLRLSLKAHPVSFLREQLRATKVLTCVDLKSTKDGEFAKVAGIVLVRQRPGTAKGVVFITLEDETGIANIVVWPKTLERFRKVIMTARLIEVHGRIQRHNDIIHLIALKFVEQGALLSELLDGQTAGSPKPMARGHPRNSRPLGRPEPGPQQERCHEGDYATWHETKNPLPPSRDFH